MTLQWKLSVSRPSGLTVEMVCCCFIHQVSISNCSFQASVVYLPEQLLFTWLELCIEFYASLSIHQSTLKYRHFGRASDGVLEPNMSLLDPDGDIGQNPWLSLHEVLLLFAVKCNWSNVLKIKDKLDPGKSRFVRRSSLFISYCDLP